MINTLKLFSLLFAFIFFGCGKVPTSEPEQSYEHFVGDFEQGNFNNFHLLVPDTSVNTKVVTKPVRKGKYALKNLLRPDDYIFNGYRVELSVYNCAKYHTSVYYGFSIMIDSAYTDQEFNLISQWQDLPNYVQGEDWASTPVLHGSPPPVALIYVNGELQLKMNDVPTPNSETYLVGNPQSIIKGKWYDLVFHFYWSDDDAGFVEAWVDSQPITPYNGNDYKFYKRNLYSRSGNYFKFGQYRGKDKTANTNVIYFDEVKVGSTFNEVTP